MVNHFRNLLLNRPGAVRVPDFPGEEYVPPDFAPRRLSPQLAAFHRAMFGTTPDRLFLNYRLRQLTTLLHSTELVDYVTAADPRITYEPVAGDEVFRDAFTTRITQLNNAQVQVYLDGTIAADDGAGLCLFSWELHITSSSQVEIKRTRPQRLTTTADYAVTDGLSDMIQLPGSQLLFRFREAPVGTRWLIDSNARPLEDLGNVLARCRDIVRADEDAFFRDVPATLKEVWETHPLDAYRFAAMVVAYATRAESMPQDTSAIVVRAQRPSASPAEITVLEDETYTFTQSGLTSLLAASDPAGRPLSITLTGATSFGLLTDNGDGTYDYTADSPVVDGDDVLLAWVSNGAARTPVQLTIHVLAAAVPVIDAPSLLLAVQDQPFTMADDDAIVISDEDDDEQAVQLTVSQGTLTLATTAGLTSVSGNGTSEVAFEGPIAAVAAALDGLVFAADAGYNGHVTLSISTSNGVQSASASTVIRVRTTERNRRLAVAGLIPLPDERLGQFDLLQFVGRYPI